MKNRFLWVGLSISLALHITLLALASRVEMDSRDVVRKVKLRMVEEAAQRKKEKAEPKVRADEKEERERKAKAAAEAEKLKALQKEVPPKVEPPKVEPPKVEPRKEEPPKKEEKPEVKPPEKKPEKSQRQKTDKPKVKKVRKQKTDKPVEPKKAEEPKTTDPQKEGPPPDGKKHGVPLDLDYAMDGTSKGGSGNSGGSGIPVVAGDGLDVPEDDGDEGDGGDATGPADGDEDVDQDEQDWGEEGLTPEDEGGPGGGNPADRLGKGVGGADVKKNEKKARVKTVAAHKVSRTASVSKGVDVPYPEEVKGLEIQGRVHLELTVDRTGKVADVKLKRGLHPVLDRVSMEAAWQLEFSPALKEGEPVAVKIPYTFTFVLE